MPPCVSIIEVHPQELDMVLRFSRGSWARASSTSWQHLGSWLGLNPEGGVSTKSGYEPARLTLDLKR